MTHWGPFQPDPFCDSVRQKISEATVPAEAKPRLAVDAELEPWQKQRCEASVTVPGLCQPLPEN